MSDRDADDISGQEAASRGGGRPEYKPTDEQRALVRTMRTAAKTIGAIAQAVGVSRNTLRKHFAEDLAVEPPPVDQQLNLAGAHKVQPIVDGDRTVGRPEFEPTQRQRDDVQLWAADDWSEDRMARQLGIARETLRKHFANELQYGADFVRTLALRDLKRGSAQGKVAASVKLLERTALVAPPSTPRGEQPARPADDEPLGKKAQAKIAARTAEVGTDWESLVH